MKQRGKNGQTHWQCDDSVQKVEDKPWQNEELERLEESTAKAERESLGRSVEIVFRQ